MQHPFYEQSAMAAASPPMPTPRYRQPSPPSSLAAGQHARRISIRRPRSMHLETLPERETEVEDVDVAAASYGHTLPRSTRASPSSTTNDDIDMDAPPYLHARAATEPPHTTPSSSTYLHPHQHLHQHQPHNSARPQNRRHSSYPIRSSPLAGPSLALTQDGTLVPALVPPSLSPASRPRSLLSISEAVYHSPTASFENLAPPVLPPDREPSPPPEARRSPSKRIALGLKRLSALPSLPRRTDSDAESPATPTVVTIAEEDSSVETGPRTGSRAPAPFRSAVTDNTYLHPRYTPTKDRQQISELGESSGQPYRRTSFSAPRRIPPAERPGPRPSSAGSGSGKSSVHRRSAAITVSGPLPHSHSHSSPHPSTHLHPHAQHIQPNTSRSPELNWLSTAAPPKFSRRGLAAQGVVLPVSAKEMRRRSVISEGSLNGSSASVGSVGSAASIGSLRSVTSEMGEKSHGGDEEKGAKMKRRESVMSVRSVKSLGRAMFGGRGPVDEVDEVGRKDKGKERERIGAETAFRMLEDAQHAANAKLDLLAPVYPPLAVVTDPIAPPTPPFFHSDTSASSLGSNSTSEDLELDTPSLSRASSVTEEGDSSSPPTTDSSAGAHSHHGGLVTPPEPVVLGKEKGVDAEGDGRKRAQRMSVTLGLVLGARGVVDLDEWDSARGRRADKEMGVLGKERKEEGKEGKLQRRGTLKRVWGRVFGGGA
ncbi:hypothetical protein BDW22DRAFT_404953 [Trametopsis cervina]|nr:hypothetical protein BDW22DRAFT_404953 [Trametopsis cervina]